MTLTAGFWDSVGGDRTYNALQMSQLFEGLMSDGIFSGIGTSMKVTTPGGLTSYVGIGRAWFNNTWTKNDAIYPLTHAAADLILPRIDTIVLEVDSNTGVRANSLKIILGTPGSVPVPPTLTNTALLNQYPLADVRLNAGVTVITSITNRVGTGVIGDTPYIASGLESFLNKAIGTEVDTGTDDVKYLTVKSINDSHNVPWVVPGSAGRKMTSNGVDWISSLDDGWALDGSAWSYSSLDGPTGVVSINSDMTAKLQVGMRQRITQSRAVACYMAMDANSNSSVGAFTMTDTAMTYTAGKFSNAATFNGTTSKIVVTDNATMKPALGTAFTIGLWMKSATPGVIAGVFQSSSTNTSLAGIQLRLGVDGRLTVIVGKNTGSTAVIDYTSILGRTVVGNNVMHYVVITMTKTGYIQIYVDGQLDGFGATVGAAYAATNYIRFGCLNNTGTDTNFYTGQIDDVYMLSATVTEEAIKAKYLAATAQGTTISDTKCSIITYVGPYSGGNTLVTSFFGMDSEISGDPITSPAYSNMKVPYGFNPNPDKWKVYAVFWQAANKNSPIIGTWYGGSGLTSNPISISAPIGIWEIDLKSVFLMSTTAVTSTYQGKITISDTETAESFPELTQHSSQTIWGASATNILIPYIVHAKSFVCLAKKTLTINYLSMIGSLSSIGNTAVAPTTFALTSAYL